MALDPEHYPQASVQAHGRFTGASTVLESINLTNASVRPRPDASGVKPQPVRIDPALRITGRALGFGGWAEMSPGAPLTLQWSPGPSEPTGEVTLGVVPPRSSGYRFFKTRTDTSRNYFYNSFEGSVTGYLLVRSTQTRTYLNLFESLTTENLYEDLDGVRPPETSTESQFRPYGASKVYPAVGVDDDILEWGWEDVRPPSWPAMTIEQKLDALNTYLSSVVTGSVTSTGFSWSVAIERSSGGHFSRREQSRSLELSDLETVQDVLDCASWFMSQSDSAPAWSAEPGNSLSDPKLYFVEWRLFNQSYWWGSTGLTFATPTHLTSYGLHLLKPSRASDPGPVVCVIRYRHEIAARVLDSHISRDSPYWNRFTHVSDEMLLSSRVDVAPATADAAGFTILDHQYTGSSRWSGLLRWRHLYCDDVQTWLTSSVEWDQLEVDTYNRRNPESTVTSIDQVPQDARLPWMRLRIADSNSSYFSPSAGATVYRRVAEITEDTPTATGYRPFTLRVSPYFKLYRPSAFTRPSTTLQENMDSGTRSGWVRFNTDQGGISNAKLRWMRFRLRAIDGSTGWTAKLRIAHEVRAGDTFTITSLDFDADVSDETDLCMAPRRCIQNSNGSQSLPSNYPTSIGAGHFTIRDLRKDGVLVEGAHYSRLITLEVQIYSPPRAYLSPAGGLARSVEQEVRRTLHSLTPQDALNPPAYEAPNGMGWTLRVTLPSSKPLTPTNRRLGGPTGGLQSAFYLGTAMPLFSTDAPSNSDEFFFEAPIRNVLLEPLTYRGRSFDAHIEFEDGSYLTSLETERDASADFAGRPVAWELPSSNSWATVEHTFVSGTVEGSLEHRVVADFEEPVVTSGALKRPVFSIENLTQADDAAWHASQGENENAIPRSSILSTSKVVTPFFTENEVEGVRYYKVTPWRRVELTDPLTILALSRGCVYLSSDPSPSIPDSRLPAPGVV